MPLKTFKPSSAPAIWLLTALALMPIFTAHGEFLVATKETPPFAMKSDTGEWEGVSIDIWKALANELDLEYSFVETELDEMLERINRALLHTLENGLLKEIEENYGLERSDG